MRIVSAARAAVLPVAIVGVMLTASLATAQTAPVRVRGTVVSLDGPALVVKSRTGEIVSVKLADNWSVSGVVKASLDDIKPGTYVGTAALPAGEESLRAIEIMIFPEVMRGTGEGHYPWDLQSNSSMTNATVASEVKSADGRVLKLAYKGGEKAVIIPADAPVVTFAPATPADIKPGAAVFIPAQRQADGSLQASRMLVGKDGIIPPM